MENEEPEAAILKAREALKRLYLRQESTDRELAELIINAPKLKNLISEFDKERIYKNQKEMVKKKYIISNEQFEDYFNMLMNEQVKNIKEFAKITGIQRKDEKTN
jgi:hypothetical protein